MQRFETEVVIHQTITYADSDEVEKYKHQSLAEVISLSTYQRLVYRDDHGRKMTLKMPVSGEQPAEIELTQPAGVMTFRPGRTTQTIYRTPHGVIDLEITTTKLTHKSEGQWTKIKIDYQLETFDGLLGEYEFRLQFRHDMV